MRLAQPGLFLLAFAVRALPSRTVFIEGGVLPTDGDGFYHLRRILWSVANFPDVLDFDPYINFPDGGKPIWPPLFDWSAAALVLPFGPDPQRLERILVWVPPLLGGLAVLALHRLASRWLGARVALVAALLLALLPGHAWYSQVGFIDHHAAVALASLGVLAAGMRLLDRPRAPLSSLAMGAAFAVALLLWPGCLLHVGLAEAGLAGFLLTRPGRAEAVALAGSLALAHAVAFALVAPSGLAARWPAWSPMSPAVLSGFQPWLLGALALLASGLALLWRGTAAGRTRGTRAVSALAAGLLLLAASAGLLPSLGAAAGDAARWLLRGERFQSLVAESRPLLVADGTFTLADAAQRLSLGFLVFPVALAAAALSVRRSDRRAPLWLALWYALGLFAATILQRRFMNCFSAMLALVLAWGSALAWRALPERWRARPPGSRLLAAALCALVAALLAPALRGHAAEALDQWRALTGRPVVVPPGAARQLVAVEAARWLARHTPETAGWQDTSVRPAYGVLAPWHLGHAIEYVARRPTVVTGFGDDLGERNFELARRYWVSAEPEAVALLEALRVRYVVAGSMYAILDGEPAPHSMYASLLFRDGVDPGGAQALPDLEHHRLVYESRRPAGPGRVGLRVYEVVRGARLVGRSAPGAEVRLSLALRTDRGRDLVYASRTRADADGRFVFRVPYSNQGFPPSVAPGRFVRLECDGAMASVSLSEDAVQGGLEVIAPGLARR